MAESEKFWLAKFNDTKIFKKFLHECIDELIDCKYDDFNNYNNDIEWTKEQQKSCRQLIQNLYRDYFFNEDPQIIAVHLGDLSEPNTKAVIDCFQLRKTDICSALIKEKLLLKGIPLVENIDWKMKWIIGSSKLASLCEPLLQMSLHVVKQDKSEVLEEKTGANTESINFEMNLDQVNSLIEKIEAVRGGLE